MGGANALDYEEKDGFHIEPLLVSDQNLSWNRIKPISNDSLQLKVAKLPEDETGSFVTAVRMNRLINGKEQRIIVASDADFLTEPLLISSLVHSRYNYHFGLWCLNYFTHGQFPPNILRPQSLDNSARIKVEDLSLQKIILYWVIPAVLAVIGSIILIRRKRK